MTSDLGFCFLDFLEILEASIVGLLIIFINTRRDERLEEEEEEEEEVVVAEGRIYLYLSLRIQKWCHL